jgi:hypothetical protein
MEYNTERTTLKIPEYGRNVQRMVDYCLTIEDKEHRSKVAQSIIDVIGNLNPAIRDAPDYAHKLWDHLFIMSDFELDVESPYPIPTAESFVGLPDEVPYPVKSRKFRHYGSIVKTMVGACGKHGRWRGKGSFSLWHCLCDEAQLPEVQQGHGR